MMQIEISTVVLIAMVGIVSGWISKGYFFGKKEQAFIDRFKSIEKDVAASFESLRGLKHQHEKDFDKVMNIFYDDTTKGPRFLTVPGHAEFCKKNTETLLQPISMLNATVENLNTTVLQLSKDLITAEQAIAVMESAKKGGSRSYDPPPNGGK